MADSAAVAVSAAMHAEDSGRAPPLRMAPPTQHIMGEWEREGERETATEPPTEALSLLLGKSRRSYQKRGRKEGGKREERGRKEGKKEGLTIPPLPPHTPTPTC